MNWQQNSKGFVTEFPLGKLHGDFQRPDRGIVLENGIWKNCRFGRFPFSDGKSLVQDGTEFYLRGVDAVATYHATRLRPTRIQIYRRIWNEVPEWVAAACETIVSVQTHLLGIDPEVLVESELVDASEPSVTGTSIRVDDGRNAYFEWLHPSATALNEFHREHGPSVEAGDSAKKGTLRIGRKLFSNSLEKGVVLRARILHLWAKDFLDVAAEREFRDLYENSDPILTT